MRDALNVIQNRAQAGFNGWGVRAEDSEGETIEVRIYDVISSWWGVSAEDIAEKLAAFPKAKLINVRVNSPGGDAFAGIAMSNLFRQHPAQVDAYVDGYAASAATIALMGATNIYMGIGAFWMVHEPWTCACGNAGELRDTATFLDKVNETVVDMYTLRTGADRAHIAQMVEEETWLSAQETVDEGFADAVKGAEEDGDDADADASNRAAAAPRALHPKSVVEALKTFARLASGDDDAPEESTTDCIRTFSAPGAVALGLRSQPKAQPAERGADPKEEESMEPKEKEALEGRIKSLSEQLTAANDEQTKLRSELTAANAKNTELLAQLTDSEKALNVARGDLKLANGKLAEFEDKALEAEVDALVNRKITAEEKPRMIRMAKLDRSLFDETIAARSDLKLEERVVPPEQQTTEPRQTDDPSNKSDDISSLLDARLS